MWLCLNEFVHQLAHAQIDWQQQLLRYVVPGKQLGQGDGFDRVKQGGLNGRATGRVGGVVGGLRKAAEQVRSHIGGALRPAKQAVH